MRIFLMAMFIYAHNICFERFHLRDANFLEALFMLIGIPIAFWQDINELFKK